MSLKWISLAFFIFLGVNVSRGGTLMDGVQTAESYRLMSDRGIYVAGEQVLIRIFNLNPELMNNPGWSSVYYLELVSPEGIPFSREKLPLRISLFPRHWRL